MESKNFVPLFRYARYVIHAWRIRNLRQIIVNTVGKTVPDHQNIQFPGIQNARKLNVLMIGKI